MKKPIYAIRLAELREYKKKTQQETADAINISRGRLSNYEQGIREPDFETIKKLAEFYNTTTDYILGISDNKIPKGYLTPAHPDTEVAKLLTDNNIKKIDLVRDISIEELQMLIEIGRTIRNKKTGD